MTGETILHYRIEGRLGKGGMGVVFRATDLRLLRTVALKFVPEEITMDAAARKRFLHEAQVASGIDHPNVGTIFGVEDAPDGRQFIVMAYYEGDTLAQHIARGPLPVQEALHIARQIAAGLGAAHRRDVVHRDIKPSNVIITPDGVVKIVDFGIAMSPGQTRLTEAGARLGSPCYMSPEQGKGENVDARTDLWSLGVVLYEALTGRCPFDAPHAPAVLYKVIHERPSLHAVDAAVRPILERLLEKDPAKRYQSAAEALAALGGKPTTEETAALRPAPRRGTPIVVAGLSALMVIGLVSFLPKVREAAGSRTRTSAAAAEQPETASAKYRRAGDLLEHGYEEATLGKAIELLEQAVRLDPRFALAYARLAEAWRLRGSVNSNDADVKKALEYARKAESLAPGLPTVQTTLGRIYSQLGDYDLAQAALQEALRLDRTDGEAYVALARLYEKLRRTQDAEQAYEQGVALQPRSWRNLYAFAHFYHRQGRFAKAIELWQKVIQMTPDNGLALTNLGAALLDAGRISEARAAYEKALSIRPNATAYMNLGKVNYVEKRFEAAVPLFEKAVEMSGDDYLPHGNLASAYAMVPATRNKAAGAFRRAIELAESAAVKAPTSAVIFADLAGFYANVGSPELARQRLQTALALDADNPQIQASAAETCVLLNDRVRGATHLKKALRLGYSETEAARNPLLRDLVPIRTAK